MKVEALKEKLQFVIGRVERFSGKHLSLPILSHFLLTAKRGVLTVRATNLDMGIEHSLPVKVEREGVIAVPAGLFTSFVASLRNTRALTLEAEGSTLHVRASGAEAQIKGAPPDDFPTIPRAGGASFTLDPGVLVGGVRSVHYAGALGNLKPELGSVYLYHDGEELVFVATDSFRLAEKKIPLKRVPATLQSVLIPVRNAGELARLLEGERDEIRVYVGKGQLSLEANGFYVTSRLVEGSFPDYRQIIPKEFGAEAVVLRDDLLGALKLTSLFSDRFNQLSVRVDPRKKQFELIARNGEVGESTEAIPAALTGAALESNFNHRYVSDCLQALHSDSVAFHFGSEHRPLLITGVGDASFRYLVMPMNR